MRPHVTQVKPPAVGLPPAAYRLLPIGRPISNSRVSGGEVHLKMKIYISLDFSVEPSPIEYRKTFDDRVTESSGLNFIQTAVSSSVAVDHRQRFVAPRTILGE